MKKILFLALIALTGAAMANAVDNSSKTEVVISASESYEAVGNVSVVGVGKDGLGFRTKMTLYKGVNTCDAYYLKEGTTTYYYPVRKNRHTKFGNCDVSAYEWMCTIGSTTYFFNY